MSLAEQVPAALVTDGNRCGSNRAYKTAGVQLLTPFSGSDLNKSKGQQDRYAEEAARLLESFTPIQSYCYPFCKL